MIIHILQARVVGDYTLELLFDRGGLRQVDLRGELYGPVFEPLRDPAYFAQVAVDPDARTITWPNGADFAPDYLWGLSTPIAQSALANTP